MQTPTLVLKQGDVFIFSNARGEIGPGVAGAGLYYRDTRYLSDYTIAMNGQEPELLDSSAEHNSISITQFTNPRLEYQDGHTILPQTISVRRYREIEGGMLEQLDVRNFNEFAVSLKLELQFCADFRDIFDIRGFRAPRRGQVLAPGHHDQDASLRYRARDGAIQQTLLHFNRLPDEAVVEAGADFPVDELDTDTMLPGHDRVVLNRPPGHPPSLRVTFLIDLGPHAEERIEFRLTPTFQPAGSIDIEVPAPMTLTGAALTLERFANVSTSNELVNRALDRSLRDVRTLITSFPGGRIITAGIPWYVAPFGRDSLIASLQLMMFSPDIAVETLRFLAKYQGKTVSDWTEEEPGKILHEQRFGEMARLGVVPHTPYYGSVDATPLFIIVFCELIRWTGDRALFDELLPAVELALVWIDEYGDSSGDGFVDYGRRSKQGLENQGWKDSDNSLQFIDRSPITEPIALAEVQGYVYQAKQSMAGLFDDFGQPTRAHQLRAEARALRERFEDRFWSPADEYYGQAIDGSGRLVTAISSNPGHCLLSGIVSPDRAEAVARRLGAPDMFSGWGVRTLSSEMPHYNPMSYHNGSVWPHDNSMIATGLRRYGFDEDAMGIMSSMLASATHFEYLRLPELFCGFSRDFERYSIPISYPVSCSPQAWASGAMPYLVQTMLGVAPDAIRGQLRLRPYLPEWMSELRVRGMQFAGQTVDFKVRGRHADVELNVERNGAIDVVLDPQA